jgi:hypothetical protein
MSTTAETKTINYSILAEEFFDRFPSFQKAHGRSWVIYDVNEPGKKAEARCVTVHEPPTPALWEEHLTGSAQKGLGLFPLRDDDSVLWAAIDIDDRHVDHEKLDAQRKALGLPLLICRSKSGGAHCYLFFSEPAPADEVQDIMGRWAAAFGYGGCEIFPKQTERKGPNDYGNWINMPYFNDARGGRQAWIDGGYVGPERFLEVARERTTTIDAIKSMEVKIPETDWFAGGPPCLNRLKDLGGFDQGTRNEGMYNVAVYLRKRYGDQATVDAELARYNVEMCSPPLPVSELSALVKSVFKKDYGYKCSQDPIKRHCDKSACKLCPFGIGGGTEKGKRKTLAEAIKQVHARLQPFLIYDEFACKLVWKGKERPWATKSDVWEESDGDALAAELDISLQMVASAMRRFMVACRVDPLVDYLNGLKWDGIPRLNRLFVDYFNAEDTKYHQQAGRKWAISAVARAYHPGCQVDYTPISDGPQGIGKSQGIRALSPKEEWFCDNLGHITNDQAVGQRISGKWLFEIAELAAFRRSDAESLKAFLTRMSDYFRVPYGLLDKTHPRRCVFFGTVNPKADGSYLVDPTGNRRFWPITITKVDIEAIKRDRDQLWAEAVVAHRKGEKWWFTDAEVLAAAEHAQTERMSENIWHEPVSRKATVKIDDARRRGDKEFVTTSHMVLTDWFGIAAKDVKQSDASSVGECLRKLGFQRGKRRLLKGHPSSRCWILSEQEMAKWDQDIELPEDEVPF